MQNVSNETPITAEADSPPLARRKPSLMRYGKMRPGILLWALGVPIPIILVIFLIRGCV